ncbi:SIR2 family protein [Mesorhizobium sp. M0203]|uniref:SIR2 family protein n=1 Tax=Mesorhizobium sp. M0203 TaxID=2956912 RepID=UPI003334D354
MSALIAHYSKEFTIPADGYTLSEITSLAESKSSRHQIITELRKLCANLQPTGGLKNLPLYDWKSIFSTNYDDLVEKVYKARKLRLRVYDSNFSFTASGEPTPDCELFKIHGTIEKDVSDGQTSQIILTEADYERTEEYREYLYDRLKGDLAGADLIIIGQSLADQDMKDIVNRAAALNAKLLSPSRIYLLMYTADEDRASLFEKRGLTVAFGGIDQFFAALAPTVRHPTKARIVSADPLDKATGLAPVTTDVQHASALPTDISAMFNGRPASYSDIEAGFTFQRKVATEITDYFGQDHSLCALLLGASGVGKTTAARQVLERLRSSGNHCWEHNGDHTLSHVHWNTVATHLKAEGIVGALLIDDAHRHLQELNDLVDKLVQNDNAHLKLMIVSNRNQWFPRIKTPNLFRFGKSFSLSKMGPEEIERLLILLDSSSEVRGLVEDQFSGFNKQERRRRLTVRCEADMFVCMKNIFANDTFDDIVLKEYADLRPEFRDVYRYVAAMETAGVRVHRQLVVRILGIPAGHIDATLNNLTEIVSEYSIDERKGIYGWRCRHPVISGIITKYKFQDLEKVIKLFDDVIDNISPTYDVEIRSLRELCNVDTGIARIPDKNTQNRLLRKMMSNAPGERVPRHRLLRNLIEQGHFEKAETEIRLFNKDFGSDGPVHRYKIKLMIERATRAPDLLEEDRVAILEQAYGLAVSGVARFANNKNILRTFAELGIEYYKRTGRHSYYNEAIGCLQAAEDRLGDPEISMIIARFNRRIAGHLVPEIEEDESSVVLE